MSAVVLGITASVWGYQYLSQPTRVLAPTIPSAIIVDQQRAVPIPSEGATLLQSLREAADASGEGITQLYPVIVENDSDRYATVAEVLTALSLRAPGNLQRDIDGVTIVARNGEGVGIILKFNNFETVLGGLYRWENEIVSDFAPLLGTSPATRFTDTMSNNRDIRVATRADGSELLYTFIDRTTLLIATDRALIGEVLNRQQ